MARIIDKIMERRRQRKTLLARSTAAAAARHAASSHEGPERNDQQPQQVNYSINATNQNNNNPDPGWFYSFEYFPPKTEAGLDNLLTRIDRMTRRLDPLFVDVTWAWSTTSTSNSAGNSSSSNSNSSENGSLAVASFVQKFTGVDVLLHLTAQGSTRQRLRRVLHHAKGAGIHNLLLLRGDPPPNTSNASSPINKSNNSSNNNNNNASSSSPRGKPTWLPGSVATSGGSGGGQDVDDDDDTEGSFDRAIDLVRFVRHEYGDYFGIAVAGHPEGHSASNSRQDELQHLKEKLEAGADFIISQFFYNVDFFIQYVRDCRAIGITCPILPGIMPIQSYASFTRMTHYCNITVPQSVLQRLEPCQHDDERVKEIGCEIAAEMCRTILHHDDATSTATTEPCLMLDGVHFYTLNLERSVTRILMMMGVIQNVCPETTIATSSSASSSASEVVAVSQNNDNINSNVRNVNNNDALSSSPSALWMETLRTSTVHRQLPWRPSAMKSRNETEHVRPIHWANRPKSYVLRTEDWDEFPNGRWGDAASPAFGELSNVAPHFYGSFSLGTDHDRRNMLGHHPKHPQDVYNVFAAYVLGQVAHIPWCENPLQPESFLIQPQLAELNRLGFLTINSQPAVNGVPSTDKTFGWGGHGGYIYQRAYCECFCSPAHLEYLVQMVQSHPAMNLYATNQHGTVQRQEGIEPGGVTALTWGAFPSREIIQPTIFDPETFLVYWAEEAFSLWTAQWQDLYDYDSESFELIETIRDSFFLVAIIDNDYIAGATTNGAIGGAGDGTLWRAMLESVPK